MKTVKKFKTAFRKFKILATTKAYPKNSDIRVSRKGRLYSISKDCEVKPYLNRGYLKAHVPGCGCLWVHRIVAETYLANPENKPEVDILNGIRADVRPSNLRWATHIENMSAVDRRGKRAARVPVAQINPKTKEIIKIFPSIAAASKATGAYSSCISYCLNGTQKCAAGYMWKKAVE